MGNNLPPHVSDGDPDAPWNEPPADLVTCQFCESEFDTNRAGRKTKEYGDGRKRAYAVCPDCGEPLPYTEEMIEPPRSDPPLSEEERRERMTAREKRAEEAYAQQQDHVEER